MVGRNPIRRTMLLSAVLVPMVLAMAGADGPDEAARGDAGELERAAKGIVAHLAAGKFDDVATPSGPGRGGFGLSAEKLKRDWERIVAKVGPFRGTQGVRLELRPTGDYAYVRCQFGERPFDARMLLGPDRRPRAFSLLPAPLGGPGLVRATGFGRARAAHPGGMGTITFPVPGTYRDQVPLTFSVTAEPAEALKGYRWQRRDDGLNWLCDVEVAPPESGVFVRWESLVLVAAAPPAPLPPAQKPECPDEARPWASSTGCVQSDDPAVRAKAAELARDGGDLGAYARRAVEFAAHNPLKMRADSTLDALCALETGSSCTGRANLAAALLRARGIPARTVAHLPTWSGPLFEHWLVEYWHPGAGWVTVEPSLGRIQPSPWTYVVLNVANPGDEDDVRTFGPADVRPVMAGAPHLSVFEISEGLRPDNSPFPAGQSSSLATPEVELQGAAADLAAIRDEGLRRFEKLTTRPHRDQDAHARAEALIAAARVGGASGLLRCLKGEGDPPRSTPARSTPPT